MNRWHNGRTNNLWADPVLTHHLDPGRRTGSRYHEELYQLPREPRSHARHIPELIEHCADSSTGADEVRYDGQRTNWPGLASDAVRARLIRVDIGPCLNCLGYGERNHALAAHARCSAPRFNSLRSRLADRSLAPSTIPVRSRFFLKHPRLTKLPLCVEAHAAARSFSFVDEVMKGPKNTFADLLAVH